METYFVILLFSSPQQVSSLQHISIVFCSSLVGMHFGGGYLQESPHTSVSCTGHCPRNGFSTYLNFHADQRGESLTASHNLRSWPLPGHCLEWGGMNYKPQTSPSKSQQGYAMIMQNKIKRFVDMLCSIRHTRQMLAQLAHEYPKMKGSKSAIILTYKQIWRYLVLFLICMNPLGACFPFSSYISFYLLKENHKASGRCTKVSGYNDIGGRTVLRTPVLHMWYRKQFTIGTFHYLSCDSCSH